MADETEPLLSQQSTSKHEPRSPTINPDNEANLELAVNDFYEAVVEGDDEECVDEDVLWLIEQRKVNKTLHWLKRPSVLMVGVCVFFVAMGQSAANSTKQIIIFKLACNSLIRSPHHDPTCDPTDTQVLVSNYQLWYSVVISVATIVASGKIGSMSDQYGRKPFIVLILFGLLIQAVVRYWVIQHFSYLKFKLMLLTEFMGNICGGILTLVTITNCYISDVVEPHERIYCLGLSIAFLFIGYSIGPLVGNLILKMADKIYPVAHSNYFKEVGTYATVTKTEYLPLKFEILMLFFLFLFGLFVLPESRSSKARKKSRSLSRSLSSSLLNAAVAQQSIYCATKEKLKQALNFLQPLKLLTIPEEVINPANIMFVKVERIVVIILVINICYLTALGTTLGEIYILHGIYRYNWDLSQIGIFLAVSCASRAFVLLIVSPVLNHKLLQGVFKFKVIRHQFDMIDFSLAFGGLMFEGFALMLMIFANSAGVFYASLILSSLGTLASPSLNSAVIKFFPESKVGELFGAIALVKNVFTLTAPVILLTAYKKGIQLWDFPGLPFAICSVTFFILAILLVYVKYLLNLTKTLNPNIHTRSNSRSSSFSQLRPDKNTLSRSRSSSFTQLRPDKITISRCNSISQLKQDKNLQGHMEGGVQRKPSLHNFSSQSSFGH